MYDNGKNNIAVNIVIIFRLIICIHRIWFTFCSIKLNQALNSKTTHPRMLCMSSASALGIWKTQLCRKYFRFRISFQTSPDKQNGPNATCKILVARYSQTELYNGIFFLTCLEKKNRCKCEICTTHLLAILYFSYFYGEIIRRLGVYYGQNTFNHPLNGYYCCFS